MLYQFGRFELDLAKVELRESGTPCGLEPQVFALLALLVENRDRLVTKEEIIEKVWDGRDVTDAAIASRVKSARQALGDDGRSQQFIKTIHGRGFRFVADARVSRATSPHVAAELSDTDRGTGIRAAVETGIRLSRPTLAVLPFQLIANDERYAGLASAVPAELIADLSRLRWLMVTARGSSFRLRAGSIEFGDIGLLLNVRYCVWGTIEVSSRLIVTVELVDTLDGGVVWADRFSGRIDDVHPMREEIRTRVLAALEIQIPAHEAALARGVAPNDLDAWSAYHLGLQHIYRFNNRDNAEAARLFQRAIAADPMFARAHAGLSFVHFQTAFMRYTDNVAAEATLARRYAARAVELDPLDPFVNFTMGRTYWLDGDLESSLGWLERATTVSPNYAQGIYARAWTESLAGRALEGRAHADAAMRLSPIDPLYYAMLATRAFTHMVLEEDDQAADWAEQAARSPGAHVLIAMIATAAHAMKGDAERAAHWAANVRERNGALTRDDFCRSFPMKPDIMRSRVLAALARHGF
jgi:TolB-like protein